MGRKRKIDEEKFKDLLRANGLKATSQRFMVLKAIAYSKGKHLTVEEIYEKVRTEYPEIGLATIYRSVQVLLQLHLIDRVNFDDGSDRYELAQNGEGTERHHHHHLICLSCGKVFAFQHDMMETLEGEIQRETGFEVVDHEVKLYGYCRKCQEARRAAAAAEDASATGTAMKE